jgi:hypothetical protein
MSVPLDPETEKTVDSIIDRLLSVRGNKPGKATQVVLSHFLLIIQQDLVFQTNLGNIISILDRDPVHRSQNAYFSL